MGRRHSKLQSVLRQISDELEDKIDDRRSDAGFHALEAMESENQDARECRERAMKLQAEAKGLTEALKVVRCYMLASRLPGSTGDAGRQHLEPVPY